MGENRKEAVIETLKKVDIICEAAHEKKAEDIVIIEMLEKTSICDYFVVMSAPSSVRVKAIVDNIEDAMKKQSMPIKHREGLQEGVWVLLDFGSVIAHIFYHEKRKFYDLEHLWGDAKKRNYIP